MKKILAFILALGMSFAICSGFAATNNLTKAKAYNEEEIKTDVPTTDSAKEDEYADLSYFHLAPQIILNPETGCYDIDIYVTSSNRYFSNFEAEINFTLVSENGEIDRPSAKLTVKQYAKGNLTANMRDGVLSMVFNATKNVDLSNDIILIGEHLLKIATFKTDLKHNLRIVTEHNEEYLEKGLHFDGGKIDTAGAMVDEGRHVDGFEYAEIVKKDMSIIVGDYDFDGVLTVKDLIAAQVYLTNKISFENEPILDAMLNSTGLQYLQMYLCESISYSEYFESVIDIAREYLLYGLPYNKCGRYWDYEYWENKTFPTDEQGYTYLGEDKYGNYHIWNNDQGVKFFITPKADGAHLYLYEINEKGKLVMPDTYWKYYWGGLTYYYGCYNYGMVEDYGSLVYPTTWDEDYWNNQTPSEEGYQGETYTYKGIDGYGNKHYWAENGFKFLQIGYSDYRYLINPADNKIIVIAINNKAYDRP